MHNVSMKSRVFVSCGQRDDNEKQVAHDIRALLKKRGFSVYLAVDVQTIQCPGSAGNGEGAFSVSEYAALRAGIFKASGSTDPIKLGKGAEPCSAAPVASSR